MACLFGRDWSRAELLAHVGDIGQVAGVRLVSLVEGAENGLRAAELRTGDGLTATVYLDRGMDIGPTEYRGAPLAWVSPTGAPGPAFLEQRGDDWARGFHAGLLTTMGISQDIPGSRSGEGKSQHARISHVPAQQVAWGDRWDGDEYHFWISGRMREAAVHSHNLSLTRRISCQLGRPRLVIEDCVENRGYTPVAHSIVYHCNFGFPLLSEGAHLEAPSLDVVPKDEVAAAAVDDHAYMHGAQAGYVQQVFYHRMAAGADGLVSLRLVSPRLGLTMEMRYRQRELPGFVQWKQLGQGMYVLGLEPCSRRAADRPKIDTVELAPGAAIHYWLEIGVNDSERNQ